jgi:hypothetical protein
MSDWKQQSLKETNCCIQEAPDALLYVDFDQFENLFLQSLDENSRRARASTNAGINDLSQSQVS